MADDTALNELLSLWEREQARGRDLTVADLCRDCPELAPEVERHIRALRELNGLARGDAADAPTSQVDQIASLCENFTGEWDRLSKPSLDAYLARVGSDARPALLRKLLTIDVERRR